MADYSDLISRSQGTDPLVPQPVKGRRKMANRPDAATLRKLLAQGKAIKNAKGEPSFYIRNADDLRRAIRRVGSGGADHDAIRRHIIKRAKALGLLSMIPDNWAADGSLKGKAA